MCLVSQHSTSLFGDNPLPVVLPHVPGPGIRAIKGPPRIIATSLFQNPFRRYIVALYIKPDYASNRNTKTITIPTLNLPTGPLIVSFWSYPDRGRGTYILRRVGGLLKRLQRLESHSSQRLKHVLHGLHLSISTLTPIQEWSKTHPAQHRRRRLFLRLDLPHPHERKPLQCQRPLC